MSFENGIGQWEITYVTSVPVAANFEVNIPQARLYSKSCMSTLTRTEPGLDQDNR